MLINNPSLTLTFTETSTSVITTSIELDSIQVNEQLLNEDLTSSSNTFSLSLKPDDTSLIDDILSTNRDIKAVLKDGNTPLFTGYVSDSFSWRIGTTGEDVFQIKLEDRGSRTLNKSYSTEDDVMIRDSFSNLVDKIKTLAGNEFLVFYDSTVTQQIKDSILIGRIEGSKTLQNILDELCFELGLAYSFNAEGNLYIRQINITGSPSYDIYSTGGTYNLYTENGTALSLGKKSRQYSQAKVKYSQLEDSVSNVPVYKVEGTTQVHSGAWWDGEEHSESIYDLTLDDFFQSGKTYYTKSGNVYTPAVVTIGDPIPDNTYYEYAGLVSLVDMVDLEKGKDIIYVYPSTVKPNLANQNTSYSSGGVDYVAAPNGFYNSRWTLRKHGESGSLDVLIDNTSSSNSVFYTAFWADARIIRKTGEANVIKAAEGLIANSDVMFTYESKWIHDRDRASNLATLLNNWYLYCGMTYTFYSADDFPLGSMVQVNENLFSNTTTKILLTSRSYTMHGLHQGLYAYTGHAISPFNLKTTGTATSATPQVYLPDTLKSDNETFTLTVSPNFVTCDERAYRVSTQTPMYQTLTIRAEYPGEMTIGIPTVVDNYSRTYTPTVVTANKEWSVQIPYTGIADSVFTITATSGSMEVVETLGVIDTTEYNKFLGIHPDETDIHSPVVVNDFYFNSTDGKTYKWIGNRWHEEDDPSNLLTALDAALDPTIQPPIALEDMSDPNTVSWFNTIVAAKAVIKYLFSQYITILDRIDPDTQQTKYGCIRSEAYDNDGNYVGPGQGFFLNSQGVLKGYSADFVNANATDLIIGGNSSFNGSFNCGVIATDLDGLTPYSYSSSLNERYCKEIVDAMEASGMFLSNQLYPCSVSPNPTRNGSMVVVAFMRYEHPTTNTYHLYFYDANKSVIDLKTCDNYQVSYEGGATPPSRTDFLYTIYNSNSRYLWGGGYFTYHPDITVLTGGNFLRLNIPGWSDRASVPAGCVFTGPAVTEGGVTYLPLRLKSGRRTVSVPTSDNTVLQGYYLAQDIANEGLAVGTTYDAYILNSSSQRLSGVEKVAITEAAHTTVGVERGGVTFYDSNGNTVNIASLMTITHKNHFNEDTATNTSQIYSGGITSTGYSNDDSWYCPSGFTVVITEDIQ